MFFIHNFIAHSKIENVMNAVLKERKYHVGSHRVYDGKEHDEIMISSIAFFIPRIPASLISLFSSSQFSRYPSHPGILEPEEHPRSTLDFPFFFIISYQELRYYRLSHGPFSERPYAIVAMQIVRQPILIMLVKQRWQALETNSHRGHNVDISEQMKYQCDAFDICGNVLVI